MRRVAIAMLLAIAARTLSGEDVSRGEEFGETMTVVRYIVEARVTDVAGRPVSELQPGEFAVTIDDAVAHVESADWISFTPSRRGEAPPVSEGASGVPAEGESARGRLVVVFVQTDFARNADRIKGHMRFTTFFADRLLGSLRWDDRVAVVAFDSHLRVLCDFTLDREKVARVIRDSIDSSSMPAPSLQNTEPSLAAQIDPKAARAVARGEQALLLVARALSQIDGDKLMFLAGWGFGDMIWGTGGGGQIVLPREFSDAVGLLHRDRTPVVTIGTGTGQLTGGIALTARATGGLHTSAIADFPEQMLTRIEGFVAGYYELVLRTDAPLEAGEHRVAIATKDSRLQVRAVKSIVVDVVDTRYGDAIALISEGLVDDGLRLLRDSVAGTRIPPDVLVERLRAMVDASQWEAALVVVEQLEAQGEVDVEVEQMRDEAMLGAAARTRMRAQTLLAEARRALLDGDDARALPLLERALATDPTLAEAWFERGMILLAAGKKDDAKTSLERCLALDPRGVNAVTARELLASLSD